MRIVLIKPDRENLGFAMTKDGLDALKAGIAETRFEQRPLRFQVRAGEDKDAVIYMGDMGDLKSQGLLKNTIIAYEEKCGSRRVGGKCSQCTGGQCYICDPNKLFKLLLTDEIPEKVSRRFLIDLSRHMALIEKESEKTA